MKYFSGALGARRIVFWFFILPVYTFPTVFAALLVLLGYKPWEWALLIVFAWGGAATGFGIWGCSPLHSREK